MNRLFTALAVALLLVCSVSAAVPVAPAEYPKLQFFNVSGTPCSACTISTYVGGTTTPLATYVDSTGGPTNPTTITLNSAGYPPNQIWFGPYTYKIVLKDALGVTIYTVDNITSMAAAGRTNIANVWSTLQTFNAGITGSGNLGTLTPGTGILGTGNIYTAPQYFKDGPWVDLTAWGADPTGVSDSAAAITLALAQAASTGYPIHCTGTFRIDSTLAIGTTYSFIGDKGCKIQAGAIMTNMATVGGTVPPPYDKGAMVGVEWDGNSKAAHAWTLAGTTYVNGYDFRNNTIHNTTGDGFTSGDNFWNVNFYNLSSCNNGGNGGSIGSGANAGASIRFFGGSFCNNTGKGVAIANAGAGGASIEFIGTSFGSANGDYALQVGTSATPGLIVSCLGCHFEQATKWLQNFGTFTASSTFFTDGSGSVTLGYLIDNENMMVMVGGRASNGGGGAIMNPAQAGFTHAYNVASLPAATLTTYCDAGANCTFAGTMAIAALTATSGHFTGTVLVDGFLTTASGLKPASGGGQGAITGDGTNVLIPTLKIGGGALISSSTAVPQVATPTVNQVACIKAAGPPVIIGYCTGAVSGTSSCTCN